ncbi:fibroblast growth factor 1 [Nilaparvata lugens]|uniref:fibroblast growth factor 1 n=1 Tax=Nilaparvata lugens TaxID=108931 RepID=UPI00193D8D0E|nr:fibroblast growth factor 1 [Nilaparvata lugens]
MSEDTDQNDEASGSNSRCFCPTNPRTYQGLPFREGNPNYGFRMQLYCRTQFHLAIMPDGSVIGVNENCYKYAMLELSSAGPVNEVRIRGIEANLYLAMNRHGGLYGEPNRDEPATVFVEAFLANYNTYLSHKYAHNGWYVGIKKTGKPKPGHHTPVGTKGNPVSSPESRV